MRLSGPLSVLIEVSSACQLRCRYCSAAPFNGTSLPLERTVELIEELGKFPVWAITFSGGEPLLHPHIFTFLSSSFNAGIRATLNTNGLKLLDGETMNRLVALKEEGIEYTLSVSLDSADTLINDSARARGAEVIASIRAASKKGLDVTLSAVVHKQNLDSALSLPDAFPSIRQFRYSPAVTRHLSASLAAELKVEDRIMDEFWQEACNLQERLGASRILLPIRTAAPDGEPGVMQKEHHTCYCGFTSCVIDSQLNVFPCDWARSQLVKMGNLKNKTLESIWTGSEAERIRTLGSKGRLCLMQAEPHLAETAAAESSL